MLYRRRRQRKKHNYVYTNKSTSRGFTCDFCEGKGIVSWDDYEMFCKKMQIDYPEYMAVATSVMCCPVCNGSGFIGEKSSSLKIPYQNLN